MTLDEAIAVFDKSAQTEAWAVIRAELVRASAAQADDTVPVDALENLALCELGAAEISPEDADAISQHIVALRQRAEAAESELTALQARVEAAPVVVIGNADAYSCWLEKWQGSESGPVHAMKGRRVRLVPEGSE